MIGAIIGDIAGSRFEFKNTRSEHFKLLARDCDYTDDTICTIAIADAVMNGRKFDEALRDWCGRYLNPKGAYGGSFSAWLAIPDAGPYWSFGNGAAMRVSAIPALVDDFGLAVSIASESARVSHDHPEGIKGAVVTAGAGFILKERAAMGDTLYNAKSAFNAWVGRHYLIPEYKPFSNPFVESCMNAVPVAAACLLASKSFEDAVRKAIVVGGDSDTIAAITGGWAEALYGVPAALQRKARGYLPDDMLQIVRQFYKE